MQKVHLAWSKNVLPLRVASLELRRIESLVDLFSGGAFPGQRICETKPDSHHPVTIFRVWFMLELERAQECKVCATLCLQSVHNSL